MTVDRQHPDVEPEPAGTTSDYRYAPIPEALLYDGTLSPTCVRVYGCLQRHGLTPDSCFPSHARIASCLGLSERSIARPLAELERAGWIARTRRHNRRGERIADGYHVLSAPLERAGSRSTTTQSSAAPPRDRAQTYPAETRGLEKQREPLNESQGKTPPREEDPRISEACKLIAERSFRDRQGSQRVLHPGKWKATAAENAHRDHAAKARTLLAAEPSLTVQQLATRLEGPPAVVVPPPFAEPAWIDHTGPTEQGYAAISEARAVVRR